MDDKYRKADPMLNKTIQPAQMWITVQEPRIKSSLPHSFLLLLSALDNRWHIDRVELVPSWDQHGLIYLVTLHRVASDQYQQLILPSNPLVESLLDDWTMGACDPRAACPSVAAWD